MAREWRENDGLLLMVEKNVKCLAGKNVLCSGWEDQCVRCLLGEWVGFRVLSGAQTGAALPSEHCVK